MSVETQHVFICLLRSTSKEYCTGNNDGNRSTVGHWSQSLQTGGHRSFLTFSVWITSTVNQSIRSCLCDKNLLELHCGKAPWMEGVRGHGSLHRGRKLVASLVPRCCTSVTSERLMNAFIILPYTASCRFSKSNAFAFFTKSALFMETQNYMFFMHIFPMIQTFWWKHSQWTIITITIINPLYIEYKKLFTPFPVKVPEM